MMEDEDIFEEDAEETLPAVQQVIRRPWEQLADETPRAFEAFSVYLNLTPKASTGKRIQEDVAVQLGCNRANISPWYKKHQWESRAEAYDDYMKFHPTEIVELMHRRELAADYRKLAKKIREKVTEAIDNLDVETLKTQDAVGLLKVAKDLEVQVAKLEDPDVKDKREQLKNEIKSQLRSIFEGAITGQLGGNVAGGSGGVFTATERQVSIGIPSRDKPIREIQELAGEVCEGDTGTDVVE